MPKTLIALAVLATVCLGACSRDPQAQKQKFIASGDGYLRQGKAAEAAIQYANAVNKDPKSGEARFKLADAYYAAGNTRAAFPEYIRAADLLPNDMEAQLRAGHMLFKGGLFGEARARVRVVLQKDPDNVTALILLGNTLAGMKNLEDATGVLERAIQVDPERAGSYTNLGVLRLAQGESAEAEKAFLKAVEVSKRSTDALLALANFYRATNRSDDAERTLLDAKAAAAGDHRIDEALAGLMIATRRPERAESYLKAIATGTKAPAAIYGLAAYYLSVSRYADAIQTLEPLTQVAAERDKARERTAMAYFAMGDRARALATIDAAIEQAPRYAPALTLKARVLLADRRLDDALTAVAAALHIEPNAADANLTHGRILLARRDLDGAQKAFNAVVKLQPDSLPALLELAQMHLARNQIDTAITFATQAVTSHPGTLSARVLLVRTLTIRDDDWPRAEKEMGQLLQRFPNAAATHDVRGALYLAQGNQPAARQAFERAAAIDPKDAEALAGLVAIDLGARRPDAARARVEAALKVKRDVPTLLLAANVFGVTGDSKRVEATLRDIVAAEPDNPESYARLAQFYVSEARLDEARREFTATAERDPKSVAAPTMLGLLAYMQRDRPEAKRWWETALRIDARAAAAANNLAWMLAEDGNDLETALQLAQVAKATYSAAPEVNDTLGWVYYRKGLPGMAVTYLQQSIDADRDNPLYHFHIGMAYAKSGEDGKARRALERALTLDPKMAEAAEAKRTIATLIY